MRKFSLLALFVLLVVIAGSATTTVVTFDDLSGDGVVPDGYGGINWGGLWNYYGEVQPPYNAHSDPNRVYDAVPDGTFTFITPQVFQGAWFAGNAFATVTFELFDGNNLVWTSATLAPSDVPTFLASGYSGLVTSVDVVSPSPDFFIMDDVTYGGGTSTPEPGSLLLMGTGLIGGVGAIRRKLMA